MLQGLVRRQQSLIEMRVEEENRCEAPIVAPAVKASIKRPWSISLEKSNGSSAKSSNSSMTIRRCAGSVSCSSRFPVSPKQPQLGFLGRCRTSPNFGNVKAVGAFAGLSPRHYQSDSIDHHSRLVKTGNANLRRAKLYFPAIVAIRHNPSIKALAGRLQSRGKSKMTIVAAANAQASDARIRGSEVWPCLRSRLSRGLRWTASRNKKAGANAIRRSRRARPRAPSARTP